jgi:hypothetical protein
MRLLPDLRGLPAGLFDNPVGQLPGTRAPGLIGLGLGPEQFELDRVSLRVDLVMCVGRPSLMHGPRPGSKIRIRGQVGLRSEVRLHLYRPGQRCGVEPGRALTFGPARVVVRPENRFGGGPAWVWPPSASLKTGFGEINFGIHAGTAAKLDAYTRFGTVRNSMEAADSPEPSDELLEVHARTS